MRIESEFEYRKFAYVLSAISLLLSVDDAVYKKWMSKNIKGSSGHGYKRAICIYEQANS